MQVCKITVPKLTPSIIWGIQAATSSIWYKRDFFIPVSVWSQRCSQKPPVLPELSDMWNECVEGRCKGSCSRWLLGCDPCYKSWFSDLSDQVPWDRTETESREEPEVKKRQEKPVSFPSSEPRDECKWVFHGIRESKQMLPSPFCLLSRTCRRNPCSDFRDRKEFPMGSWTPWRMKSQKDSIILETLSMKVFSSFIFLSVYKTPRVVRRSLLVHFIDEEMAVMPRDHGPLYKVSPPPGQLTVQWDSSPAYFLPASSLSRQTHGFCEQTFCI